MVSGMWNGERDKGEEEKGVRGGGPTFLVGVRLFFGSWRPFPFSSKKEEGWGGGGGWGGG